ncbi:hypothetical protein [Vibrio phage VpV262]|uniref:Uncharacterized protein n=1 Tax=Vibrio phage VpV262 TaxID=2907796 RepID=Q8LT87_9CAUD|nr:hypothetical protein VpV262p12 [Vibrio phage VpV262]AAM28360.1 hypothetical protein [Vibrio phage VpV262]
MAMVYGIVAIIAALCCGSIVSFGAKTKENPDVTDYIASGFILTIGVVCLVAGLDWLNLIPEM